MFPFPLGSGDPEEVSALAFHTICHPGDLPSGQPLKETLLSSGEQPRTHPVSCFLSSLAFPHVFGLLPLGFVLILMQGNCGLPENTSKYYSRQGFPKIVVLNPLARIFCSAVAMVETKNRNPSLCFEGPCSLLQRQDEYL